MKYLFFLVLLIIPSLAQSQDPEPIDSQTRQQLDSIIKEADLLYKYEKSAWVATDLVFQDPAIKDSVGEYLTYQDKDEIKTIFVDKERENCIAEYIFKKSFDQPDNITTGERALTDEEINLLEIRTKILEQLSDQKYKVNMYEGFSLNPIIMPEGSKYKLYLLTGTSQPNIIPFGNDYLFEADRTGKIKSFTKFHSTLIAVETIGPNGEKVIMPVHTHLRTTPLITATDICTFRLYGSLYHMDEFMVYSPALGKYMRYSISANDITIERKDRTK